MRTRTGGPEDGVTTQQRPGGWRAPRQGYAEARKRPLSAATRRLAATPGRNGLGPYETRYDVRSGYETDRDLIRP